MKTLKKVFKWIGIILLILIAIGGTLYFIYLRPFMQKIKQTAVINYDKELTIITGGGGNSAILTSDSLVLVIDTKMDEAAEDLYKKVKELAGSKPVMVINTHYHPDHTKGNSYYRGSVIIAGDYTKDFWLKNAGEETLPGLWLKDSMVIRMGDETVTLVNLARKVHTGNDVMVYLNKRKLLFGGDVILNKQAPMIMGVEDSDPDGYVWAMDMISKRFDIQKIVPGHGDIGGPEIITDFNQYFTDMRTAAEDESKKSALVTKYKDWNQIPVIMSPGATISLIKKKHK